MNEPTMAETLVNQGGLMRCCLASLADWIDARRDETAIPGTLASCAYEQPRSNDRMILGKDLTWRWNRETDR